MTAIGFRRVCVATILVATAAAAVGAARWLGPAWLVGALTPLGRAPLFLGCVGAVSVYALVQSLPGGRAPVALGRPWGEGWAFALGQAMLCGALAAFPLTPGGSLDVLASALPTLVAAFFFIDRIRRVQRRLAESP